MKKLSSSRVTFSPCNWLTSPMTMPPKSRYSPVLRNTSCSSFRVKIGDFLPSSIAVALGVFALLQRELQLLLDVLLALASGVIAVVTRGGRAQRPWRPGHSRARRACCPAASIPLCRSRATRYRATRQPGISMMASITGM